jgi:predicted O-linked N-acetylglucosamine transferase (SPINDLY family)
VGLSLLTNAGLPELAADSADAFVDIAVRLANDRDRLVELRITFRERLIASSLMDAPRFTRNFERAIEEMWSSYAGRP